ncbi:hypothetical protein BDW02DRAFT_597040 [Decorospora gaudefroyi]|uniref:Ankyrin n=1 Tax=Decorospora gaudefroyi TaxID=184978 RepID=A0A6A5KJ54_9PLEO|nr:hypothetical protein BDW02DRAFT_597040 [Decorospora gaudefroyi]
MALLLKQRGDEVKITEEVVQAAAGNWDSGKEVMTLLLEQRGDEVKITEKVVRAAACNPGGEGALQFLLERNPALPITEEVVRAAACNPRGKDAVELLLNFHSCISISEDAIALIDEDEVWTGVLESPPFCFYDAMLMKEAREGVLRNLKETKSFLKAKTVGAKESNVR